MKFNFIFGLKNSVKVILKAAQGIGNRIIRQPSYEVHATPSFMELKSYRKVAFTVTTTPLKSSIQLISHPLNLSMYHDS